MTDSLPPARFITFLVPALIGAYLATFGTAAIAGPPAATPTPKSTSSGTAGSGDIDIMSSLLSTDANPDPQVRVVASAPPSWFPQFAQALAASQAGKHEEAERIYRKLLKAQPKIAEAWANLGILEAQDHHDAAAIADSEKAASLAADPHLKVSMLTQLMRLNAHSANWQAVAGAARRTLALAPDGSPNTLATAYLGIALIRLGRYTDALTPLRKRAMLAGEPPTAGDVRLIFALEQSGHGDEAFTTAQELAQRFPKDAIAQATLGDAAVGVRRIDVALTAFGTAYVLRPEDMRVGQNAVAAAVQMGRNDLAFQLLERMLKRTPDDAKLLYAVGKLYFLEPANSVEQFQKAEVSLQQAATKDPIGKDPSGSAYISLLGHSILMQQNPKRFGDAQKLFQSALKLDSHDNLARLGLGYLAEQEVQFDKAKGPDHYVDAIAQYKAVIADDHRDGYDAKARRRLAGIYLVLNQKPDGYKQFEALIARYPADTSDLSELASLYFADERYEDAANSYRKLIAAVPRNPSAYIGLGQTFEHLKKPAEAQAQYEAALKADPGNGTAALALGNLFKSQNKEDDAIAVYEAAVKASPNNNQLHLQLGADYEQKGRLDDAIKQYQALTILKNDPNRVKYLLMAPTVLIAHARSPEAETMLTRIYNENGKEDEIAFKLAAAHEGTGHPDAAVATLKKVIASHADKPQETIPARLQLAELDERLRKTDEAASSFEDILRIDLANNEALMGLSRSRSSLGHPEAAGAFIESLALADPMNVNMQAVHVADHLYGAMDRTPERYTAFLQALTDKYPNDRPLSVMRIEYLLDLGGVKKPENRVAAGKLIQALLIKTPVDSELHYRKGMILEEDGRKSEAIAEYTTAVTQNYSYGPGMAALTRLGAPVPVAPAPSTKPTVAAALPPSGGTTQPPTSGAPPGTKSQQRP